VRVIRPAHACRDHILEMDEVAHIEHTVWRQIACRLLVLEKIQVRVVAGMLRVGAAGRMTRMTVRHSGDVTALHGALAGCLSSELVRAVLLRVDWYDIEADSKQ